MRAVATAASVVRHSMAALSEAFLVAAIVAAIAIAFAPLYHPASDLAGTGIAVAGKGGGNATGSGGKGGKNSGSSLTLTLLDSTDGSAHWGQRVTFDVSTSNAYPVVSLYCTQGGTTVYGDSRPMYQPNPFDDPGIFTLSSLSWSSGGADCRADLKGTSHGKVVTLASISFGVKA